MKLRTKLVLAGMLIVLVPMLLSTGVIWYLIQRQNDEDARHHSAHLLDMIREELARQGRELASELIYFAEDSALINNIMNLNQRHQVPMTPLLQEIHEIEAAIAIGKFARINHYDVVMVFDQTHTLLSFARLENNTTLTLGIVTTDDSGRALVKVAMFTHIVQNYGDIDPGDWNNTDLEDVLADILPEKVISPIHTQDVFEHHLALKTAVPVHDKVHTPGGRPQPIGNLIGYRYVDQSLVASLAQHTQAHVNVFIHQEPVLGTLPELTKISSELFEALSSLDTQEQSPYIHSEQNIAGVPYYITAFPLVREPDGALQSTLVLSVSKVPTYQNTRQAVIVQSWVSVISVLFMIPFVLLLAKGLTDPIRKIAAVSESISKGLITEQIEPIRSQDELGNLSRSFHGMVLYLREMAQIAENISRGELHQELSPQTKTDVLGIAFHRMTTYLQHIAQAAGRIQKDDLTYAITPYSERDVLGTTFNAMIHRLQELVTNIRSQAQELADASQYIAANSENISHDNKAQADSIETTTFALHEMASSISQISQSLTTQSFSIEQVKSSAQHIVTSSEDIANRIDHLSSFTAQTAAAMEKMDDFVQNISQQVQTSVAASKKVLDVVQKGTEQMGRLMDEIMAVQQQMEITSSAILRLQRQSRHIGEILTVIQEVVDQTNLLSLNASIISAQAGTHGRAFSVVAEEIKALANRTSESTKEIAQFIKTIQTELTEAVSAMVISANYVESGLKNTQQTEQVFEAITSGAEQSSQLIAHTAQSIEEHSRASHQIKQASAEVVGMLEEIMRLTQEQHAQSEKIHTEAAQLTGISGEIQHATQEQSSAAHQSVENMSVMAGIVQQTSQRVEHLATLAVNLSKQADDLLKLVEQFKVNTQIFGEKPGFSKNPVSLHYGIGLREG
ncbi:methyl-accepting chemotaxis sensory transducer, putative [Candidatus Vecturithrix granuli]|uniref:Methyl-accepting chemotaxis sensory transducer, putative n=1 Tax=Vecturithrix granuli TaxID=1499967 RepID=A0A081BXM9_VECG1|nr:methyl-accepting chemotaxis sensory transducer, putative [Candidatus Vecturithrix granuli]